MKENKYNNPTFFKKYAAMARSTDGLASAGEWPCLERMLPPLKDVDLLDIGCGYGWHCIYAKQKGARRVCGVDISDRMLQEAQAKSVGYNIEYSCNAIEDMIFPDESFDVVMSSLAFHYVADIDATIQTIHSILRPGGTLIFSCEHPIFTAQGSQDWHYDEQGEIAHFPVDRYFEEGRRESCFLGESVVKYHATLTTYIQAVLRNGFVLDGFEEPTPPAHMVDSMKEELRRPMMMILRATKQ